MSEQSLSTTLYDADGIEISVRIPSDGNVELYEQDFSPSANVFGSDELECWLTIMPEGKDQLILALLNQSYQGDSRTLSKLRDLLDVHKITYKLFTH